MGDYEDGWRLTHLPGLDGLRGVAILMVVVGHLSNAKFVDAWELFGVVVFFTLSGFLITALLVEEHRRTGGITLRTFWLRRAARLLPALIACVTAVCLANCFVPGFAEWPVVLSALLYVANWVRIMDIGVSASLSHVWSLSVEEQFYVIWPLLALPLFRRSRCTRVTVVGVAVLVLLAWTLVLVPQGPDRVYFGTDTRAVSLLLGALVALMLHGRPTLQLTHRLAWMGVTVLLVVATLARTGFSIFLVGPWVVSLVTVGLLLVVCSGGRGLLTWSPLVAVGRKSYGLYLWHWPVIVLLEEWISNRWVLAAVSVPIFTLLTVLSWKFVEEPWLRRRPDRESASADTTRTSDRAPAPART